MGLKLWLTLAMEGLIFLALLFGAAGTIRWPAGWAYIVIFSAGAGWIILQLARHDPALLVERMRSPFQKGQPFWDKILILPMMMVWCGWIVLMGLDAVRFRAGMAAMRRRGVDRVVVLDDRSRLSGEPISDGGRENPKRTGTESDFIRTLRHDPPSALCRHADLSAGECVAAWLVVRSGGLVCSFRRPCFSDRDGGPRTAARS